MSKLMDEILSKDNLTKAYRQVMKNKGASGVDRLEVHELAKYLETHGEEIIEKETRYGSQYPVKESPMENLKMIREKGMEDFLVSERARWTCKKCGGIICVHTGKCNGCGVPVQYKEKSIF